MLLLRTICCVKMNDLRIWAFAVAFQTLLLPTSYCIHNHRRSMAVQGGLSVSKGGWRPVVGSSGLLYGTYGTSQLQSPYKIPIPVMDTHQSSSRPAVTRDTTKITSIAQSYRPTTLRTVSAASSIPAANQPISTYHNPFAVQNNGYNNFKFIQNYPGQSFLVRNPYNPYSDRNIYAKYPTKLKQNSHLQNGMLQQLTNVQPIQFGQYQAAKPLDIFGKPIETYVRPNDGKKSQSNIETFKPEVFKLDNDAAPQSINQHIKTAQQQSFIGQPNIGNPYFQYTYQNNLLPPNVLGSFGTFGVQTVKGRDPTYQFPTTFGPSQQPKQIFSYTYNPTHKTTAGVTDVITTRAPVTSNKIAFGTTYSDLKNTPTPQTKLYVPQKIDPNADYKDGFKPSPQDPYSKNYQSNFNKVFVNSYNSANPTTTLANNFYEYSFPIHTNQQSQIYQKQPNTNINYEKKKQVAYDSVTAGNQQPISTKSHSENVPSSYRPTYEVIESTESEFGTQTSPTPWPLTPSNVRQASKESGKRHEFVEILSKPGTTSTSLPDEYAIVTEAEKGYGNNLSNDGRVESQNKRPLSSEFEPIGAHKLKEYYYKVSTPIYDDYSTSTRTNPTESAKYTSTPEITTLFNNNKENTSEQLVTLPTLPPTQHYRRPSSPIVNEKDRVRKRNKVRRRRPVVAANNNNNNEETATRVSTSTVSTTAATITTGVEEVYTIRPRLRTTKSPPNLTTPTVTTDLTTSALPTISPTIPTTIVKKKLAHRRPITSTTARLETTTLPVVTLQDTTRQDSPIMKITSRTHLPRQTYDYKNDYTHKQDEKDTPTSDVTVSLSDTLRTTLESEQEFSFHKDFKPIEAKLEPMRNTFKETTTAFYKEESSDYTTTSPSELTTTERSQRPRLRNKFHRNKFNVKDYRNRLSSTTTTTEQSTEGGHKVRLPQRRQPYFTELDTETTTERKKFVPKEPRHKLGHYAENTEPTEKDTRSYTPSRQRQTTTDYTEPTTSKVTSRVRNAQRKTRPPEDTTETNPTTIHTRRPLRKKIVDSEVGESVQDFSITENDVDEKNEITSERTRSESAIMKIADKKHHDHIEHLFEHSKRVSDLTLAASKDYNKPGMFKTVSLSSRRIPNYFTIATDDPILPIEAFFPQLNQKKES